jgi:hypothetical protein
MARVLVALGLVLALVSPRAAIARPVGVADGPLVLAHVSESTPSASAPLRIDATSAVRLPVPQPCHPLAAILVAAAFMLPAPRVVLVARASSPPLAAPRVLLRAQSPRAPPSPTFSI